MKNVDNVKKIVDSVIKSYPNFRTGEGNKVHTLDIFVCRIYPFWVKFLFEFDCNNYHFSTSSHSSMKFCLTGYGSTPKY
jgi:hypothetical protein